MDLILERMKAKKKEVSVTTLIDKGFDVTEIDPSKVTINGVQGVTQLVMAVKQGYSFRVTYRLGEENFFREIDATWMFIK